LVACSASGVHPDCFWDLTYREVFAVLKGRGENAVRQRQLHMWAAWHEAAFERQKRLPDLNAILRKLEPARVMSPRELRAAVLSMAAALDAKVIRRKKNEG